MIRPVHLIVVEGNLEEPVAHKLLHCLGLDLTGVTTVNKGGRVAFWRDVLRYNRAAELGPVFALTDLDWEPCCSGLIAGHLGEARHPDFVLRIAVRALESWLLADAAALSRFLQVPAKIVPRDPDTEPLPKQTLVNLARKSRSRSIKEDLVPEPDSKGVVGKNYTARMSEFVLQAWNPLDAQHRSRSLQRALAAIRVACGL
jgi:hypothetical protein